MSDSPLDEPKTSGAEEKKVETIDILFNYNRPPNAKFTFMMVLGSLRDTYTFRMLANYDTQVTVESFLRAFNKIYGYDETTIWTDHEIKLLQKIYQGFYYAAVISWTEEEIEGFIAKKKLHIEKIERDF